MIDQVFTLPTTIARIRQGPLSEYIDAFAVAQKERGYAEHSIRQQIVAIGYFSHWLKEKHIAPGDLDYDTVDRFLRLRQQQSRIRRGDQKTLKAIVAMLAEAGITTARQLVAGTASSRVVDDFRFYLRQERRLSEATLLNYIPVVEQFLSESFGNRKLNFSALSAPDVTTFVTRHAQRMSPVRASLMVTALRSFFRYLRHRGVMSKDLAGCVPAVPKWSLSTVPRFLPTREVEGVLKCCDRKSPVGRRNYVILLLLARLGLRAGEVVGLTVDDLDWSSGQITIRGKGGTSATLPLSPEVGQVLAAYLRDDRPNRPTRRVFIRDRAPFAGFANSSTISSIVSRALKRAGVKSAHTGAHVLRHSLATGLLRRGSSLDEIGELLRHRSPNTTAIYAKVDVTALHSLALRWPGGAR
jgi:site-specific recombinase XerD